MESTVIVFIYSTGLLLGIFIFCVFSILKQEIKEQRRFRKDFYSTLIKYDKDLYSLFCEQERAERLQNNFKNHKS